MPPFIWFFDREPTVIQGRSFFGDVSGAIGSVAGALPNMGGSGGQYRMPAPSSPTVVQRRRINWSWTPLGSSSSRSTGSTGSTRSWFGRRPERQNAYIRYKNSVTTPVTYDSDTPYNNASSVTYNSPQTTYDNVSPTTYNVNSPKMNYNNVSPTTYNVNSPKMNYKNTSPVTYNVNSPKMNTPTPTTRIRGRNTTSERELMKLNKRVDLLRRETEKLLVSPTPTSEQDLKRLNKRMDLLRKETDALSTTTRPYKNTTSERELMKLNKRMDLLRRETDKLLRGRVSPSPMTAPANKTPSSSSSAVASPSDRFRRAARTASAASAFRTPTGSVVARRPSSSKTASTFRSMAKRLQEKRTEYFASTETDLMHLKNLLFQVLFNMPELSMAQKKDYVRNLKGLIEPHLKEVGADTQAFRNFDYVTESKNKRFLDIRKDSTGSVSLTKFKVSDDVLKNMSEVMLPL